MMARRVQPLRSCGCAKMQRAARTVEAFVVIEKLDFLVRFWELRARYEALGVPLTKHERLELLSLLQLIAAEDEPAAMEAIDPARRGIPAQITAGSGFLSGD